MLIHTDHLNDVVIDPQWSIIIHFL